MGMVQHLPDSCKMKLLLGGHRVLGARNNLMTSQQVYVSFHHVSVFNLSQGDLAQVLSRGIWIFAGVDKFSLGSSIPGFLSQVYELAISDKSIRLIEHYQLESSNLKVVDTMAEYVIDQWVLTKNPDVHLRRRDLRGTKLRCIAVNEDPFIMNMRIALQKYLNFTCAKVAVGAEIGGNCRVENETCDGRLGYLTNGKVDVVLGYYVQLENRILVLRPSLPTYETALCLYGLGHQQRSWQSIFTMPFHPHVWCGILGIVIISTIFGIFVQSGTISIRIFNVIAIIFNQSLFFRIWSPFLFLLSITSFLILSMFSTALTSSFATRSLVPFSSVEEFGDSYWTFGAFADKPYLFEGYFHSDLKQLREKKNPVFFPTFDQSVSKIMEGHTAILNECGLFEQLLDLYHRDDYGRIKKIFEFPIFSKSGFFFTKKFPLRYLFDRAMLKVREAGIPNRLNGKYSYGVTRNQNAIQAGNAKLQESISLNVLRLPFFILLSGILASVFIFFVEIACHYGRYIKMR